MTKPRLSIARSRMSVPAAEYASIIGGATAKLAKRVDQDIDAVRNGTNPGVIHELRIDLVKLTTILKDRPSRIDVESRSTLLDELRWLKMRSADVRDWDVLLGDRKIWNPTGHGDKALSKLLSLARAGRQRAADSIAAAVRTERCALLQDKLFRLAHPRTHSMEGIDVETERNLTGMLERAFKAVRKRAHACDTLDPDDLHSLRKAIKRLRYTCEILREGFGGRADTLLSLAHSLQRALGTIHDAEVSRKRIKYLSKGRDKSMRHRAKALCSMLKSRQRKREKKIGLEWERFHRTKRFWTPLFHAHRAVSALTIPSLPN